MKINRLCKCLFLDCHFCSSISVYSSPLLYHPDYYSFPKPWNPDGINLPTLSFKKSFGNSRFIEFPCEVYNKFVNFYLPSLMKNIFVGYMILSCHFSVTFTYGEISSMPLDMHNFWQEVWCYFIIVLNLRVYSFLYQIWKKWWPLFLQVYFLFLSFSGISNCMYVK